VKGRFGPYITDGKRNARVPKDRDPAVLELQECQRLLAEAPASRPGRKAPASRSRRKAGKEG
jgi:DNA topoisomerase-1